MEYIQQAHGVLIAIHSAVSYMKLIEASSWHIYELIEFKLVLSV